MLLIGDAHGLLDRYSRIVCNLEGDGVRSILLGELGFKKEHDWFINSPYSKNNKILFGNHDYFPYLDKPYSFGRFSTIPERKMFLIAGGYSIDKAYRKEGLTWFKEEEMTFTEQNFCGKAYLEAKPEIVVSHDAPMSAVDAIFNYSYKYVDGQSTNKFFEILLKAHRPRVWVFAHHHESRNVTIKGTRFICLDELQTIEADTL